MLLGDRDIIDTMDKICVRGSRGGFYMTRDNYIIGVAGSFGGQGEVLHEEEYCSCGVKAHPGVTPGCKTPARR